MSIGGLDKDRRNFLLIAGVAIAVIVVSFLLRPGESEHAVDANDRPQASESTEATAEPRETPRKKQNAKSLLDEGQSQLAPSGFDGKGSNSSLTPHKLTVRITSASSVGLVAWIIPTSTTNSKGTATTSKTSWSMTTTVHGRPDYAAVFAQAGPSGVPVTCELSIDGRVTERRSTKGPYGSMWCLG